MRMSGRNVTPLATYSACILPLQQWLYVLTLLVLVASLASIPTVRAQSPGQIGALRKEAEDLFYHGFEHYMLHAFPEDELRPISCKPLTRDRENPAHIEVNDPLGNYSLTLIDSLSTLAILASNPSSKRSNKPLRLFQNSVRDLVVQYGDGSAGPAGQGKKARGFDLDSKVQVFETAIRGLGGLLSAHLFAVGDLPISGYNPPEKQADYARIWRSSDQDGTKRGIVWPNKFIYDGQLLRLAYDLGERLLPAFWSSTGIPYPRVNLRHGIPFYLNSPINTSPDGQCKANSGAVEITETCSAGAGSLVLEFTVLSRLTGDPRFEELAKRAFWAIWQRKSNIDLIGGGIDAESGNWVGTWTGVGAGIDSFFEYAFKSHVLLSRGTQPVTTKSGNLSDPRVLHAAFPPEYGKSNAFLEAWNTAHAAIQRHLYRGQTYGHPHYVQADLTTGAARGFWMDALSAYYPGLLTLAGHVEEAIETHLLQTALWTRFSGLPERWNLITGNIEGGLGWWIGRPEFIESTYYLYRATEDPWYFHVGEMVLRDIKRRCWTRCGWASIQNVLTGEKADRMESFFLGETAKYLFLLFDPEHPLNRIDEPFVFTTEGHPLVIPRSAGNAHSRITSQNSEIDVPAFCPVRPVPLPFSVSNISARGDVYHAASLARLHLMPNRDNVESVIGEYTADHPSITLSDISSPSNYTYYPWTLPPELVSWNATSSVIPMRPTLDITFPAASTPSGTAPPLQRVNNGILINTMAGLRLSLIQDVPLLFDDGFHDVFRVQTINNIPLGKDEKVFLSRDTGKQTLSAVDPNFSRVKDLVMLDVLVDLNTPIEDAVAPETTQEVPTTDAQSTLVIELPDIADSTNDGAMKAAWNAIVSQISSLMRDSAPQPAWPFSTPVSLTSASVKDSSSSTTTSFQSSSDDNRPRYHISAVTPTGPGAAPLPEWPEAQTFTAPNTAILPLIWDKIYVADQLCNHKLPSWVAKNHQVLVIKRGGCDFSDKLQNIPSFVPNRESLQLVVIVSYGNGRDSEYSDIDDNEEGDDTTSLIRPFLERQQITPAGLPRRNPIPMVLVGGGKKVYDAFKHQAVGVGVKRRYHVETSGVKIENFIIV
jgi:hypothetical protein